MFSFLKNLFKKELEKEQVNLDSLSEWFDNQTNAVFEGLNESIKHKFEEIKGQLNKIKEDSELLLNAEVENPEKIQNKVKDVVLGNREQYIRSLNGFIRTIDIPPEINPDTVSEFCSDFEENLALFGKNTVKTYYTVQHLFAKQVGEIAKDIKKLDNAVKEIKEKIDKSGVKDISLLKKEINEFKKTISKKSNIEQELEQTKSEIERVKVLSEEIGDDITKLEQSPDFLEFETKKNKLQETENNLKELKEIVISLFSPLETAFKKFKRLTVKEDLVNSYIEDPVKALLMDSRLFVIEELLKMKAAIISDSVILRDKKREKAIEKINEITEKHLEQLRMNYNGMLDKREELILQIKNDKSMLQRKELEYKLEHYDKKLKRIEQEASDLEGKGSVDIEQVKKDLEEKIKNTVNIEVTVS